MEPINLLQMAIFIETCSSSNFKLLNLLLCHVVQLASLRPFEIPRAHPLSSSGIGVPSLAIRLQIGIVEVNAPFLPRCLHSLELRVFRLSKTSNYL